MENIYTGRVHGFPNWTVTTVGVMTEQEGLLSLVVVLGSSISLVGLVFSFITYSLFSDLRNLSGTTLMNLLAALFMAQLIYVIGVGGVQDPELCVSLSFSLHYLHLTVFCWLSVMTHDMYNTFRRNINLIHVSDPGIGRAFAKYSVFAWGSPLMLLVFAFFLHWKHTHGNMLDTTGLKQFNCWFLDTETQVYSFMAPVGILVTADAYLMIRSGIVVRYTVSMQIDQRTREKMRRKRRLQLFLYMKIVILLTLVMVFGSLARLLDSNAAWIVFNVGHSLQGIVVALAVTCNCQVLNIYTKTLKRKAKRRSKENLVKVDKIKRCKDLSRSASLQMLTWEPTPDAI